MRWTWGKNTAGW